MTTADIRTRIEGAGGTTLVLVHGFGCALEDWDAVTPRLAARHRCIALDLPGHGASVLPDRPSIATLADAVNHVRLRAGGDRQVLVGHSLGAKVIREAFCRRPEKIAGLVLIDGALYQGDCQALAGVMAAKIDAMGFAAFAAEHFETMFGARSPAALRHAMIARAAARDPAFARALYLDAVLFDHARGIETLEQIDVPVLVLQSTEVVLPSGRQSLREGDVTPLMRAVLERTPHGVARIVPDAGHFTMIDAPERVAAEIEEFIAGLPAEGAGAGRNERRMS